MSRDYDPEIDGPKRDGPPEPSQPELPATKRYPVCPECGCNTLVMFTPPKEDVWNDLDRRYALIGSQDYVDWDRAHLYCCNGETDCKFDTRIRDLVTPMREQKYQLQKVEG